MSKEQVIKALEKRIENMKDCETKTQLLKDIEQKKLKEVKKWAK